MHATSSARKLLMGLSDKKGHTADELTEKIIVKSVINSSKTVFPLTISNIRARKLHSMLIPEGVLLPVPAVAGRAAA